LTVLFAYMMIMDKTKEESLLFDYASGNLSENDCAIVEQWIADSDENRKLATQIASIEQTASRLYAGQTLDVEKALTKSHKKIGQLRRKRITTHFTRIAAGLSLPLLLASLWLGYRYYAPSGQDNVEIRTTTGMTSCATLPDGSQVWLNSNSTLLYPARFSCKTRNVTLVGEGYFKVTKQNGRKFVVSCSGVDVEVLGTEFNVEAYPDKGNEIRTTLLSGKVKLHFDGRSGEHETQELLPGDSYSFHTGSRKMERIDVNPESVTAWKDGRIILDDTSLEDALRIVENRYNVEFIIKNPELLKNRYSGTFSDQSLEVVLGYFERTTNMKFDRNVHSVDSDNLKGRQIIIVK